jgi:hypothetical protein
VVSASQKLTNLVGAKLGIGNDQIFQEVLKNQQVLTQVLLQQQEKIEELERRLSSRYHHVSFSFYLKTNFYFEKRVRKVPNLEKMFH